MFKIGDKVRVAIVDRSQWATGAAESLDGATGVVEDTRKDNYLVRFDKPAKKWWANSSPVVANWFEPCDLVKL